MSLKRAMGFKRKSENKSFLILSKSQVAQAPGYSLFSLGIIVVASAGGVS